MDTNTNEGRALLALHQGFDHVSHAVEDRFAWVDPNNCGTLAQPAPLPDELALRHAITQYRKYAA